MDGSALTQGIPVQVYAGRVPLYRRRGWFRQPLTGVFSLHQDKVIFQAKNEAVPSLINCRRLGQPHTIGYMPMLHQETLQHTQALLPCHHVVQATTVLDIGETHLLEDTHAIT